MSRRYLGSWVLPSGNSCNVFLEAGDPPGLTCAWDDAPGPHWPAADVTHWRTITFPAVVRAVAEATGLKTLGLGA